MRQIRITLLLILTALFALPTLAYDFEFDGLYYDILDENAKTCAVTGYISEPEGELVISSMVSDGLVEYTVIEVGGNVFRSCDGIISLTLSDSLTAIGGGAFCYCEGLTTVIIPGSLTSIGEAAFWDCNNLTSVTYTATKPIESNRGIFSSKNATLYVPNASLADIKSISPWKDFRRIVAKDGISVSSGYYFDYEGISCQVIDSEARTCYVSGYTDSNVVEGDLIIPSIVSDGLMEYTVTEIGDYAFRSCESLTSVTFPNSLITIKDQAFQGCYSLNSVIFFDSLTTIEYGAFMSCRSLTSAILPNSLTTLEDHVFYNCQELKSVILPESLITIGDEVFYNCQELKSVILPESLITIGDGVFGGCYAISVITYNAVTPITASGGVFEYTTYSSATLYMPNATLADIKATMPWSLFNYIVANDGGGSAPFEYEGLEYSVVDSKARTCKVIGYEAGKVVEDDLIIPSTVSDGVIEYTVTEIGDEAFRSCESITSVTFPESLTTIGVSAFSYCTGLTSLTFPISLITIGNSAFLGCENIISIIFSDSLKIIEDLAFCGCNNLTSLSLPNSLTTIGDGAFYSCGKLTSIILPDSLITIKDEAFFNCISLTSVTYNAPIPIEASYNVFESYKYSDDIYKKAILYMPNATLADIESTSPWNNFMRISAKDGISISPDFSFEFNSEGIIYSVIDAETRTCMVVGYEDVLEGNLIIPSTVSDGVLEYTVIKIGNEAFRGCRGLTSVTFPESLATIEDYAFSRCTGLTSLTFPESLTTIESGAFYGCSELISLTFSKSLTTMGSSAFSECIGLTSLTFPESLVTIGGDAFSGCTGLTSVTFPESLTTIESDAFLKCSSLTSVTLPASLTTIGKEVFAECYAIKNVTYNAVTPITATGSVFEFTTYSIATLYMPNATLADIQATVPWNLFSHIVANNGGISAPFEYDGVNYSVIDTEARTCKTAQSENVYGEIVIPSTVSDGTWEYTVVEIGQSTFYQCMNLTSVTLPESVTSIGWGAFYQCTGLKSMTLPESVTSIGWGAFYQCTGLTSVHFPESLTSIGELAFYQCTGLKSINLPESLTSIGELAFRDCVGLSSLILPESLTSIGELAFRDCKGLTSVTLPESLTSLGDAAFIACDAIMTVNYDAVVPIEAEEGTFEESVYETATLNMPNASLTDIKATMPWNKFRHVIAKDGTLPELTEQDFEYEGIVYTIIDEEARTCRTRNGEGRRLPGNQYEGNLVIPSVALDGAEEYTVTEIGEYSFNGCAKLLSVTIPASVENVGNEAFGNCQRLTSLVWHGTNRLENSVTEAIGNPNLLVYVDATQYAPTGMDSNIVVMSAGSGEGVCERLVLTPGYAFSPVQAFTSRYSTMTKEFTQTTPIDGCAGWETIVLPFDVTSVSAAQGELTPFAVLTDINRQYPYWLYEADAESNWKAVGSIRAGVPYIISMPNNKAYEAQYCISGPVTFTNTESVRIMPVDAEQYVVEWKSGHKFCPLWLPLDNAQAVMAMGLNVGMDNLTDDAGQLLEPGSAFHIDVEPRPLEAYVTRLNNVRALRIRGAELSHVSLTKSDNGLEMETTDGALHLISDIDRTVEVFRIDGIRVATIELQSGESRTIDGLDKGVYIVAGRKVMIK